MNTEETVFNNTKGQIGIELKQKVDRRVEAVATGNSTNPIIVKGGIETMGPCREKMI